MKHASATLLVAALLTLPGAPAARASELASATPRAASHSAQIADDAVTWTSRFVDNETVAGGPDAVRIDLQRPVVATIDGERSPGVAPVIDVNGAVTALVIDPARVPGWRREIRVTIRARLSHEGAHEGAREGDGVVLEPPLARGDLVQRIEVAGEGDLRFEPAASPDLVHEVGAWSASGIAESVRRATDERLGGRDLPLGETPIYVASTSSAVAHGLHGRALTAAQRARPGMITAIAAFLLLIAATAAAYAWLARGAQEERTEAILREEFEKMGR